MHVEKRCPSCDTVKPLSEFNKNAAKRDGLGVHCKICAAAYNRKYAEAQLKDQKRRDKLNSDARERYSSANHTPLTYIIASGGLVKIGTTSNLQHRLQKLRCGSALPLRLLATTSLAETDLHKRFSHLRQHGEWFRPNTAFLLFLYAECVAPEDNTCSDATTTQSPSPKSPGSN